MGRAKLVLWLSAAWIVTLVVGWLWGASGRLGAERAFRDAQQRLQLSEARVAMLSTRLSLQALNFGEAGAQLDLATARLEQARQRFLDLGQTAAAGAVADALALVEDTRQKARALDQSAREGILDALKALDEVEGLRSRNQ
jgi:hypothetical protein